MPYPSRIAVELWTNIVGNPLGRQKAEKLAQKLENKEAQNRLLELIKEHGAK